MTIQSGKPKRRRAPYTKAGEVRTISMETGEILGSRPAYTPQQMSAIQKKANETKRQRAAKKKKA